MSIFCLGNQNHISQMNATKHFILILGHCCSMKECECQSGQLVHGRKTTDYAVGSVCICDSSKKRTRLQRLYFCGRKILLEPQRNYALYRHCICKNLFLSLKRNLLLKKATQCAIGHSMMISVAPKDQSSEWVLYSNAQWRKQ